MDLKDRAFHFLFRVRIFPTSFTVCIWLLANCHYQSSRGKFEEVQMLEMPWKLEIERGSHSKLPLSQIVICLVTTIRTTEQDFSVRNKLMINDYTRPIQLHAIIT
jgi:hypothetical protein